MKQQSLAIRSVFEKYGRKSRRELFLNEMEQVVPWPGLEVLVRPHYGPGSSTAWTSYKRRRTGVSQRAGQGGASVRILKHVFAFDKVRYRGLAKNHRLCANFALVNLYLHRKRLAVLAQ